MRDERIEAYARAVSGRIRWKRARGRVTREMECHLCDARDAYMAQGMDEAAATETAIAETGDAERIGAQLDALHRPIPQWVMLLTTAALLVAGLLINAALFGGESNVARDGLVSRIAYTGAGVAVMLTAYFFDYTLIGRYPKLLYGAAILLVIATFPLFPRINGRILIGQYSILLFPVAYAAFVYAMRSKGYLGIALCGLAFMLPGFVTLFVPSIAGLLHFAAAGLTLMFISIHRGWFGVKKAHGYLMIIIPILLVAAALLTQMNTYRWHRIASIFDATLDPNGAGYFTMLTRDMLSGSRLLGAGEATGRVLLLRDANPFAFSSVLWKGDLMLTALTYRAGWFASAAVVAVMGFFIIRGFALCFRQRGMLGFLISLAVMTTIAAQTASYILYNLGTQFAMPIALPLVSHGNTATAVNLGLIGLAMSVFRMGGVAGEARSERDDLR